jgi:hypothetical protein
MLRIIPAWRVRGLGSGKGRLDTYAEYPEDDKEYYFKKVPVAVIGNLEQYQFARAVGVHCLGIVGPKRYLEGLQKAKTTH